MIQATVAVYPLGQADYTAVHQAIEALRGAGLRIDVQSMHTEIAGAEGPVFDALKAAFHAAQQTGAVVMTIAVTNACSARVIRKYDGADQARCWGSEQMGMSGEENICRTNPAVRRGP